MILDERSFRLGRSTGKVEPLLIPELASCYCYCSWPAFGKEYILVELDDGNLDGDDPADTIGSCVSPSSYWNPGSAQMSLLLVEAAPLELDKQQKYPLLS